MHYYYRMGILPTVFGPFMWATIHYVCLAAPANLSDSDKKNYKTFFDILPAIIPCQSCGVHLSDNYNKLPIDNFLTTNKELFKWSVDLHNLVNSQLGKSQMSVDDAHTLWTVNYPHIMFRNQTHTKNKFNYLYLTIAIIILLLLVITFLSIKLSKRKTR